jgi:hypothetical protein
MRDSFLLYGPRVESNFNVNLSDVTFRIAYVCDIGELRNILFEDT